MRARSLWDKFKERLFFDSATGFSLDTSRLNYDESYIAKMDLKMQAALEAMSRLEAGEIANPDEGRMVGHYWLRAPQRSPSPEISSAITSTLARIKSFAAQVHSGTIAPQPGAKFTHILLVGIGGSALGPQFANQALGTPRDPMSISFFDNTDPDGMAKVVLSIPKLEETLVIVISKSGGTKETRNGQLVAKSAFEAAGLDFRKHFVAVTGEGSELDKTAVSEGWLERFPMWDWIGGRTSEFSAVGLLALALQGVDVDRVLKGAAHMDGLTRSREIAKNPAALLALAWFHCGCGKGMKDMVVLPYKDRLELFSRYLQQLVMESLGKRLDRHGQVVHQGLAVYGNKGSTDQHAYVQQLRDGIDNFFVTFLEALDDPTDVPSLNGEQPADFLEGFLQGTRSALSEGGRQSLTITLTRFDARSLGALIALFERAVGFYAELVDINAYDQPGVEAGKKAAAVVLALQGRLEAVLADGREQSLADLQDALGLPSPEPLYWSLRHLCANPRGYVASGSWGEPESLRVRKG